MLESRIAGPGKPAAREALPLLRTSFKFLTVSLCLSVPLGKRLFLPALPTILLFLQQPELREDTEGELFNQVVNLFGRVVEGGHGGHYGGGAIVDAEHIFQMDAIQRGFAQAQNQRAALFQADICGASE